MKLKHAIWTLILGAVSGFSTFAILNSFEEIRRFSTFLLLALLTSLLFSAAYSRAVKKLKNLRFFIPFTLATFLVSVFTFTLYLGFALMQEQAAFLHVRKVALSSDCALLSEEDLENYDVLRRALKSAEISGSAMIKISPEELKKLSKYYGKCVIYNGSAYEINVAVT